MRTTLRARVAAVCAAVGLLASSGWRIPAMALATSAAPTVPAGFPATPVVLSPVSGPVPRAGCPTQGASTPRISVNPADPAHEVVTWETGTGTAALLATTDDEGRSWSRSLIPDVTSCSGGPDGHIVDPYLALGPDDHVLATSSWVDGGSTPAVDHGAIHVYLSGATAGRQPAGPPLDLDPGEPDQRAPIVIERARPSHVLVAVERVPDVHPGTYVPIVGSVAVLRSTDGGRSFSAPLTLDSPLPGTDPLTSGLVQAGSAIIAVVGEVADAQAAPTLVDGGVLDINLFAYRSSDDGQTFSAPVYLGQYRSSVGSGGSPAGCCIPDLSASPQGGVALVWPDESGGIHLVKSTDSGRTWKTSVVAKTPHGALEPAVAVLSDMRVAVAYYDRTDNGVARPYLTVSPGGGHAGFTVPLAEPFSLAAITDGNDDTGPIGPYQAIAVVPGAVRVVLTLGGQYGHRPGDEEVWQATVGLP